ncbi:glycosyltransferase family 59 protein [Saccharata proteae CBS 121410]|uniref:Dol-P-Glc:Glc(2)Man(9)GlcNAc(2)-PP-Dol alpha-1,2-glucosyltransferase n=1 Tax=Saccharata proteae CBS 121410 TaxID=1314787 RepID=A0A9P4LXD7_9PEZI|nr:glycosyltransferase family 59 protein [Saccharata proteae CBS 121410]
MELPRSWGVVSLASIVLLVPTWEWLSRVSATVPQPYLDEFFHVRQAQVYCDGNFGNWDPKITTPPGLYLLSYLVFRLTGRCDIFVLRALNCTLALFVSQVTFSILSRLYGLSKPITKEWDGETAAEGRTQVLLNAVHTAFNICLFPPLFFFYGLYYTDVPSTLFVLCCYLFALRAQRRGSAKLSSGFVAIVMGTAALSFRQTNIFWVAVFPAGLSAVQALKRSKGSGSSSDGTTAPFLEVVKRGWNSSTVYDVPVQRASIEEPDYVKTILSLGVAALRNPITVILAVWPYVSLLGLFGAFVLWNGGVVLGDKSNHVATLHLPQMLYIWPYILFFSFPILIPPLIASTLATLPRKYLPEKMQPYVETVQPLNTPRISLLVASTAVAAATVHFNTIVHPFTLADNRHYVFYVFRILLRHPAIKYLATPAYIISAWLVLQALGASPTTASTLKPTAKTEQSTKNAALESSRHGCQTSFVLIWFVTAALNLITAPLVEPRYFIVPWIMWRLHVPLANAVVLPAKAGGKAKAVHDQKLWLETGWFGLVNLVMGYIFLRWGFEWPQEPGNVQRFMW